MGTMGSRWSFLSQLLLQLWQIGKGVWVDWLAGRQPGPDMTQVGQSTKKKLRKGASTHVR